VRNSTPGPVAQTFFVDDEIAERSRLDGIVTLVDALHVWQHIDTSPEAKAQVAFADVILLNEIDLVEPGDLDKLEKKMRAINAAAKIYRCRDASVAMDAILDVGGFDLGRAKDVDPAFLEPEYPFESIGIYRLPTGVHELTLAPGPDPSIRVALVRTGTPSSDAFALATEHAVRIFSERPQRNDAQPIMADGKLHELVVDATRTWHIHAREGYYALITQHLPDEFALTLRVGENPISPKRAMTFKANHEHDASVSSVGIRATRPIDPEKFNRWLRELVATQGQNLYRLKGVLDVAGEEKRWVFQGVHMLVRGQVDRAWKSGEERASQLIFIGRDLDRTALNESFAACLT